MKDCKLIVSDLDGTLLLSDMTLSDENAKAIEEFKKRGIIFVPSSGRTFYEIPECVRENPNVRYLTYSNGTAVYDKEKGCKILSHEISREDANKTLDILTDYDVFLTIHLDGKAYYDKAKAEGDFSLHYRINDYYRDIILSGIPTDNLEALTREAESVEGFFVYFNNDEDEREVARRLSEEVESITVTSSVEHEFELCSTAAGKGAALAELSEMFGISGENIIAMGDSANDTSMFPYARLALCVSNASDEVKALADEVACSYEEHLADFVLKKYIEPSEPNTKKPSLKMKIISVAAAAVVVISLILSVIIFGDRSSALKVGYKGISMPSSWSATYKKLDGKLRHSMMQKDGTLSFSIKTTSGNISVEVVDSDGNTIFDKDNIGTETFEVKTDGWVKVIIEAENHEGSFVIG